jgi:hypothetical protein
MMQPLSNPSMYRPSAPPPQTATTYRSRLNKKDSYYEEGFSSYYCKYLYPLVILGLLIATVIFSYEASQINNNAEFITKNLVKDDENNDHGRHISNTNLDDDRDVTINLYTANNQDDKDEVRLRKRTPVPHQDQAEEIRVAQNAEKDMIARTSSATNHAVSKYSGHDKVVARSILMNDPNCQDKHRLMCQRIADQFDQMHDTLHKHYEYTTELPTYGRRTSDIYKSDISQGIISDMIKNGKLTVPFSFDKNDATVGRSTVLIHHGKNDELMESEDVVDPAFKVKLTGGKKHGFIQMKVNNSLKHVIHNHNGTHRWDGEPLFDNMYTITPTMVDTNQVVKWFADDTVGLVTMKHANQTYLTMHYDFHKRMNLIHGPQKGRRALFSCIAAIVAICATTIGTTSVTVGAAIAGTAAVAASGAAIGASVSTINKNNNAGVSHPGQDCWNYCQGAGYPENCWTGSGDGFCGPNGKCDYSDGCVAHDD